MFLLDTHLRLSLWRSLAASPSAQSSTDTPNFSQELQHKHGHRGIPSSDTAALLPFALLCSCLHS